MKKNWLLFVGLLLIACKKEQRYEGEVNLSGYCYNACADSPLENYYVQFTHEDVTIETATDSNGYFELKESYSFMFNPRKPAEPEQLLISDLLSSNTTCSMIRFLNLSDSVFVGSSPFSRR